jgi:RsiW-degrading membrane proteinase PrsW (M82 family)
LILWAQQHYQPNKFLNFQPKQKKLKQIINMNKALKHIFSLVCLIVILTLPYFVFASNPALTGLTDIQKTSGFTEVTQNKGSIFSILGAVVSIFLSLLGIIFIILMIYGGYNWMIAAGDEGKVTKAKDTFKRAIIGLIITLCSYIFWNFLYLKLMK